MDSYGIFIQIRTFRPQIHHSGPPKHKILGLGVGGISVKLFLSVLISATGIFSSSILKSLVTHLASPT